MNKHTRIKRTVCFYRRFVFLHPLLFSTCVVLYFLFSFAQPYFPETGRDALYQRSLDLQSNLNVLSIALQPGYEDLAALAYFRLGRGARIISAYVTNGEAGESDIRGEYPSYLAAQRREEASKVMSYLNGEAYFLNMPDIAAASDSATVRKAWPSDTLQIRLMRLFSQLRPDIVIVARDWAAGGQASLRWDTFYADLLAAVKRIAPPKSHKELAGAGILPHWDVRRVVVDDGMTRGIPVPATNWHPRWKKQYQTIAEEAAQAYRSLALQRKLWKRGKEPSYRIVYPAAGQSIKSIDAGLERVSVRLRWIETEIRNLSAATLQNKTKGVLKRLVTIMDTVDHYLARSYDLQSRERKTLLHWKEGLENLRCCLLGVEVVYAISDTVLAERQLTYFKIDTVKGIQAKGSTEVFFPGVDQGWAINEWVEGRLPLKLHETYRLLSPARLEYNVPHALYGLQFSSVRKPFMIFVIHRASSKEQSFVHRTVIPLSFAPRFVTEVLTPVVLMSSQERMVVRLTNYSRDSVKDTIKVQDSLAISTASAFRLPKKEASHLDTLFLTWKGTPADGSYLIPISISGMTVAQFVARKLRANVDTSKMVGIVTGIQNSPTEVALRRLNIRCSTIVVDSTFPYQIKMLDVLIIDRRALTLREQLRDFKNEMDDFVRRGGHLIILAQDATSWNEKPLWDGVHLSPTLSFDENVPLVLDSTSVLLTSPNIITSEDWQDWLFLRGYNFVSGPALEKASLPVRAKQGGTPLLLSMREGTGKRTYVDLALQHQWLNIHAGAFRLLANLISY